MRSLRVWYWRRLADIKVSAWPLAGLCVDLHSTLFWKIGCFLLRRPRGVYSIVDDRAITLNKITSCFLFFVQRTFQLIGIQYSFLITLIWLKIFHCQHLNNFLFNLVFNFVWHLNSSFACFSCAISFDNNETEIGLPPNLPPEPNTKDSTP